MLKIVCPNCGAEYLPAEIFYPNEFFGKPATIEKTSAGKIQFFTGTTLNTQETYTCDYCKRKMRIKADIDFKAYVQQIDNHVTKFTKSNLFLEES